MTPKPDSRLPWRVVSADGRFHVIDASGSFVAGLILTEEEAHLIAQAPELQSRVQSLTTAKDQALAILERIQANPVTAVPAIRQAIEVLKRI